MKIFVLSFFALLFSYASSAQKSRLVKGIVTDTVGVPLSGVTISLTSKLENLTAVTNARGEFEFSKVTSSEFEISATSIGFENYSQTYLVSEKEGNVFAIHTIQLKEKIALLNEVIIERNPVTIKEDTIQYDAQAYKVREGAPVEDVIKKLPGVTVDKDGNVTAQGQTIKRVRVNGKDYFGGDVQTATQNVPADIIESIQIIDDYGDKANLTGIKEGEAEKVLNITIKKGKSKGNFGNASMAAGTENRYVGGVSVNHFKDDQQISFLGAVNNTNGNTFNFNGGGKGGGARGANLGSVDRSGSGGDGNTVSKSLGFNYKDNWGEKISSYGSYSYTGRNNKTIGSSFQQDLNPSNVRTTSSSSRNKNISNNHRLTWNLEYKIDTANFLKVSPYFSYASSTGSNSSVSDITTHRAGTTFYTTNKSRSSSGSYAPSGGTDFFFNHKLKKRGRNYSISAGIHSSLRDQSRDGLNEYYDSSSVALIGVDSMRHQFIKTNAENTAANVRFSYNEPLGKYSSLEASYTWNISSTKSIRNTDDVDPLSEEKVRNGLQSNDYKYNFITNRYGLSFNVRKLKYNFLMAIAAQPANLVGMDNGRKISTSSRTFNFKPSLRFAYNFARSHSLTINYGGSAKEPAFAQLQPVADSSNSKNIVIGNPNLNAEFTNKFNLQYNKVGILTGRSFFSNLSLDQTQNKIVRSVVNATQGTSRTSTYINTNGFYNVKGSVSFTQPFSNKKFTATVSAAGSFDNNISFTDNQKNNGQNWVVAPSARFRLDLPDIVDAALSGSYSINKTVTNYAAYKSNMQVKTLQLGVNGKNYFFKDWTLGYDFTKIIYTGFASSANINPSLLSLYVEYRILKKNAGALRIQGFDLFDQNTGITRTVNGTTITDTNNERLGRYFLLSFNVRLQKFSGSRKFQRIPGARNRAAANRDGNNF